VIPCYQICKDRGCPHWDEQLMDCPRLPDECEYVVEHLVSDRENQFLDGKIHGLWNEREEGKLILQGVSISGEWEGCLRKWDLNGTLIQETFYKKGCKEGRHRTWYKDGRMRKEEFFANNYSHGVFSQWHSTDKLFFQGTYEYGKREGVWRWWGKDGNLIQQKTFLNDVIYSR